MVLIQWLDRFDIGIPEIDAEHRELVDLINVFHEHLLDPKHTTDVADFLGTVYARMAAHFKHEELEMLRLEYAEYWPHKGDHERLLDELRAMISAWNEHRPFDGGDLSQRLERWFSVHFQTFDARLHGIEQRNASTRS